MIIIEEVGEKFEGVIVSLVLSHSSINRVSRSVYLVTKNIPYSS